MAEMIAFVAIQKYEGGAKLAYLPNTQIPLPDGWEWLMDEGEIQTEDVSDVRPGFRLEAVCEIMNQGTGIEF